MIDDSVGECHAGAHPADLAGVYVGVEGLGGGLPPEVGGEAEDGGIPATFRRNNAVPVIVMVGCSDDTSSAGHVALAGEDEDLEMGNIGMFL